MESEWLQDLIGDAVSDTDLRAEDIPSIDLYLDQITSLVSDRLELASPRFQDRILTKTMVNNYSKDGLLSPIKGKKYSKEQFLQMLLVYAMKNTLSIGEIKRVLQNVYALPEYDKQFLERTYDRYLDEKQHMRERSPDFLEAYLKESGLDPENEEDFLVLLLSLSCMSSYIKTATQALLESHYPDPEVGREREMQEKKAAVKRQKAERKKSTAKKKSPEQTASAEEEI